MKRYSQSSVLLFSLAMQTSNVQAPVARGTSVDFSIQKIHTSGTGALGKNWTSASIVGDYLAPSKGHSSPQASIVVGKNPLSAGADLPASG